jgi:protein TonB
MRGWLASLEFGVLHWALAASVLVHGALLTVRFVDPAAFERVLHDTPLEVVLVNARADEPPLQAQALAQANLAGGGDAAQGRAASPLPPMLAVAAGDAAEDTVEEARRKIAQMQQQQQQLLAQMRRELALLPPPDPRRDAGDAQARDLGEREERRRQMLHLLAEIERRVDEENARPRKRYVSPATREVVFAQYYDQMRRRIEERGTRDFPTHEGRKLHGELIMKVTVDAAGRVVAAEVVRGSVLPVLDRRAVAIVHAAAPFGPFSAAMRRETDQIVVTSRFKFTRDYGLQATMLAAPSTAAARP